MEHFEAFSIDQVIRELQADMPDVYSFFLTLGKTERNREPNQEGHPPEELKALMSVCTLLNSHETS